MRWKEDGSVLLAYADPTFLAKTQLVEGPRTVGKPVVIKALSSILTKGDEDRCLCPVRAVKYYLKRTESLRENKKKLFVSYQKNHEGEIAKGTITGWIRKAVTCCYELCKKDRQLQQLYRVGAHDLRRFSSSWAFERNVSLESIMTACRWSSHTTFTSYYLRDMAYLRDSLLELGPLVMASSLTQ